MNILGRVGTDAQIIEDSEPTEGWVVMLEERPSSDHIAQEDGTWIVDMAGIKHRRRVLLNEDFAIAMAALHTGWPDYEIQTWTVQADEAKQWIAAAATEKPATPFLTSLHAQRVDMGWDEPFEDLVQRVIENTNAYTAATASLIAKRHVAERAINGAEDPSQVSWDFSGSAAPDS